MRIALALTAGAIACLAAPAMAQAKPNLGGEQVLADFAHCAARTAPRATRAVLDTAPDTADEQNQIDLLIQNNVKCLNLGSSVQAQGLAASVSLGQTTLTSAMDQLSNQRRQMSFSRRAVRGAIAAQLYLDAVKTPSLAPAASSSLDDRGTMMSVGYAVVRCAVSRDPVSADRLVRSKRLSSAEADAARALSPALNACARGKGKVDLSGTALRGWAAEALFALQTIGAPTAALAEKGGAK